MSEPIWYNKNLTTGELNALSKNTCGEHLGIEFTEIGNDFLMAKMPVDHRTQQPYGLLHGGASVVLAETLGSVGSAMVVDPEKYMCVGLEVNANHLSSVKGGFVKGICSPIRLGRTIHVWEIKIHKEDGKLICISRLTVAVIRRELQQAAV
ncbi:MAG: hotdog fold thioesterase [Chitinophagaceae bacterium]|nr:hotdog fold thioesterase [Chitinophagaceae bacterium]